MNKKVVFINMLDDICTPTSFKIPKDATDFQLNHNLVQALKSKDDIVRVNLFACMDKTFIDEMFFKETLGLIAYTLSACTNKAVMRYYSYGSNPKVALADAMNDTAKISLLSDKGSWLIVTSKK